jgi:hypothetical protein
MFSSNKLLLVAFMAFIGFNACAQEQSGAVRAADKLYHARIILTSGQKLRGVIQLVGAEGIQMQTIKYRQSYGNQLRDSIIASGNQIHYAKIKDIKIRGNIGESIAGFFVGTLAG